MDSGVEWQRNPTRKAEMRPLHHWRRGQEQPKRGVKQGAGLQWGRLSRGPEPQTALSQALRVRERKVWSKSESGPDGPWRRFVCSAKMQRGLKQIYIWRKLDKKE